MDPGIERLFVPVLALNACSDACSADMSRMFSFFCLKSHYYLGKNV